MNVKCLAGFLSVALIALLARPVSAATYEVQITREQHQRFVKTVRVWQDPQPDDILSSEANGYKIIDRVDCEVLPYKFPGGATPKFLCALLDKNGIATKDVIKIKYGLRNSEIPGEVAGANLLRHLGFGGDHMQVSSGAFHGSTLLPSLGLKRHSVVSRKLHRRGRQADARPHHSQFQGRRQSVRP